MSDAVIPLSITAYWLIRIIAFDIRPARINGHHIRLSLVSRRSRYRAGTRYFRRGIDRSGHVANFVETEQVLLVDSSSPDGLQDEVSAKQLVHLFGYHFLSFECKASLLLFDGSVS